MTREPPCPGPSSREAVFQGAILAAGEGRRIQPFSGFVPKPLLPLLDRPLLAWQVERLRALGIAEVAIVIGHLGDSVRRALGDGAALGVRIEYVEQPEVRGIAHAVSLLEGVVDRPFVLLLGDVHFVTDDLAALPAVHAEPGVQAVLATKDEPDEAALVQNFSVETDESGRVRRVVEKPARPATRTKGTGQYVFDESIFEAVRRTPRSPLRNEYELTDAVQVLIDGGGDVRAAEVIREDLNLTGPGDLLELNLRELARRGLQRHVAPDAQVEPEAEVNDSAVLARARVAGGAVLERCLVMPGERVGPGCYRDAILVEGRSIAGR